METGYTCCCKQGENSLKSICRWNWKRCLQQPSLCYRNQLPHDNKQTQKDVVHDTPQQEILNCHCESRLRVTINFTENAKPTIKSHEKRSMIKITKKSNKHNSFGRKHGAGSRRR